MKLKDVVGVTIPATQVGRYPRPDWYNYEIGDRGWVDMCVDPHFLEAYTDGVRTILMDHQAAGLDIVTDGCLRYDAKGNGDAAWDGNGVAYVGGTKKTQYKPEGRSLIASIIGDEPAKDIFKVTGMSELSFFRNRHWWTIEEEPSEGKLGIWVDTAKLALENTEMPLKFSGPSAGVAAMHSVNKSAKSDRDIYFALHRTYNKILREIANAGCKIIQMDFPFGYSHWATIYGKLSKDSWRDLVDAFNEEISGVNAHIWVHFCFGVPITYSPESAPLTYSIAELYPYIAECKMDCVQSEAAATGGKFVERELSAWKDYCPEKDIAVGAVTPYNSLETSEDADRIVEKALRYVPPEKLALSSDEGLSGTGYLTRSGAMNKMIMLVNAARKARKDH